MAKAAAKKSAARITGAALSFPFGTGQRVGARPGERTKFRKLITGINPRVTSEVKLFYPKGSSAATATGIWESGSVSLGAGPLQEFDLLCRQAPLGLMYSLLDVTIVVTNDGQSTSTDETVEIEIVTAGALRATESAAAKPATKSAGAKSAKSTKTAKQVKAAKKKSRTKHANTPA